MNIQQLLMFEEGFSPEAYYCSEGYPTIGIGTVLGPKGIPLNFYTLKVNEEVAMALLQTEVDEITEQLNKLNWFNSLDSVRQTIILSMAYQMGVSGLLKFKNTIAALTAKDFDKAQIEALDSRWAKQTPERAIRQTAVLATGSFETSYDAV